MADKGTVKPVQVGNSQRTQPMSGAGGHRKTFLQRELATQHTACGQVLASEPGDNFLSQTTVTDRSALPMQQCTELGKTRCHLTSFPVLFDGHLFDISPLSSIKVVTVLNTDDRMRKFILQKEV